MPDYDIVWIPCPKCGKNNDMRTTERSLCQQCLGDEPSSVVISAKETVSDAL